MKRLKHFHLVLAIFLLFLTGALRLHQSATLGTQADEGIHVTVAERLATSDAQLYRDLFENRTPGVEWLLATLFRLTGPSIFAGRVLSISMAMLTVAAIFVATREGVKAADRQQAGHIPTLAGLLAGALFALAPLPIFWARFTMLEHFATAAATLSVALTMTALNRRRSVAMWCGAGLLAALAVGFKQTELTLVALIGLFFILQLFSEHRRAVVRGFVLWLSGLLVGLFVFAALLSSQGTLTDFLSMLSGAERLAPLSNWDQKGLVLWQWVQRRPHVPLAFLGLVLLPRFFTRHLLLAAGWAAVALITVLLPPELDLSPGGFSHYVITPVAALSILGGMGGMAVGIIYCERHFRYTKILGLAMVLLVALTLPGYLSDVQAAIAEREYPQPDFTAEQTIGRAAAMLTATESEPILVLGNSVFYHWAHRAPASRFFHFPAYFKDSPIGAEAVSEWTALLTDGEVGLVLVSRLHMQERLPEQLEAALWSHWTPVALFPYPYQRDIIVFRPATPTEEQDPVAAFGDDIKLLEHNIERFDGSTFLLRLVWQPAVRPADDYTVFVHVRAEDGQVLAQADSVPAVGYRPTASWQADETIVDYHWISLNEEQSEAASALSVGLYQPGSGTRLPLTGLHDDLTIRDQALIIPLP